MEYLLEHMKSIIRFLFIAAPFITFAWFNLLAAPRKIYKRYDSEGVLLYFTDEQNRYNPGLAGIISLIAAFILPLFPNTIVFILILVLISLFVYQIMKPREIDMQF